ncbi:sensor histidine kinase [Planctomycetes bacterium K23_9]|uniref:histidine kinase n=1 Tax=Stieleria marina TaxID=1930275 RepID=A0A517NYG7_9BACT|nr:Sensor protein FixL [Planctomycetes bacterium K23_9]
MRVLLVEDESFDEEAVRRLMPNDTTIHCVRTLRDAVKIVTQQSFNLILLDLGLPDSSGLDSFTTLRDSAPLVPIVVLTGLDDEHLAVLAIREGAQDFLVKGYLDSRALRSLGFAVERDKLTSDLLQEQAKATELEGDLRKREQELAHISRVALMGEVTAEIAHEISQPLQAIANLMSTIEMIAQKDQSTPASIPPELSKQIHLAIQLAQRILSRTRGFVRKSDAQRVSTDLVEIVKDTLLFVDFERKKHRIELSLNASDTPLNVLVDGVQIQQVIVNLLRNATDAINEAAKESGPIQTRQIGVRCFRRDQQVVVEVEDSGSGIQLDAEDPFAPFVTTKPDGLGMGLPICMRIMRSHDGQIKAKSTESGTIIEITLPEHSQ